MTTQFTTLLGPRIIHSYCVHRVWRSEFRRACFSMKRGNFNKACILICILQQPNGKKVLCAKILIQNVLKRTLMDCIAKVGVLAYSILKHFYKTHFKKYM